MSTDPDNRLRAFFGRRKGHPLRRHQTALLDTLLPQVAVETKTPPPDDLRVLYAAPVKEVRLEIGFGGAEHLLAQARDNPSVGYLGSDGFLNAIAKALAGIEANGLGNIRLHHGDAAHLLEWLPAAAVTRIDLLYPDPWPKRRHWKRRFVQDSSLKQLARVLRSGGEFRFATDIAGYAAWTLARAMRSSEFEWMAETAQDWRQPWPGFGGTRYEDKSIREGRLPCYLMFRRR